MESGMSQLPAVDHSAERTRLEALLEPCYKRGRATEVRGSGQWLLSGKPRHFLLQLPPT